MSPTIFKTCFGEVTQRCCGGTESKYEWSDDVSLMEIKIFHDYPDGVVKKPYLSTEEIEYL